jgi:hypothetical protein
MGGEPLVRKQLTISKFNQTANDFEMSEVVSIVPLIDGVLRLEVDFDAHHYLGGMFEEPLKVVNLMLSTTSTLEYLKLTMNTWENIDADDVLTMQASIQRNRRLSTLDLRMCRWGMVKDLSSKRCLEGFPEIFKQLPLLKYLTLDFGLWKYDPASISSSLTQIMSTCMQLSTL